MWLLHLAQAFPFNRSLSLSLSLSLVSFLTKKKAVYSRFGTKRQLFTSLTILRCAQNLFKSSGASRLVHRCEPKFVGTVRT